MHSGLNMFIDLSLKKKCKSKINSIEQSSLTLTTGDERACGTEFYLEKMSIFFANA